MNNENKGIHATGVSSRVWAMLVVVCAINVVAHLMNDTEPACTDSHALGRERRRRRLGSLVGWPPRSACCLWRFSQCSAWCRASTPKVRHIEPRASSTGLHNRLHLVHVRHKLAGRVYGWGVVPAVGSVNVLISGVVGLLFIGVGSYLPRVKQNYTLGIKTPRALADPENWRRTQRFGGACFMVLGIGLIVMGVAGSVLSSEVVAAVIAALAFGSVGAVYAHSYLLWRKSQRAAR